MQISRISLKVLRGKKINHRMHGVLHSGYSVVKEIGSQLINKMNFQYSIVGFFDNASGGDQLFTTIYLTTEYTEFVHGGHRDLCVTPYIPDSYRDSVVKKINNKKALDENMWNFFESVAR